MNTIVSNIIHFLAILILAPLVSGIIKKIKAFTQKRKGPPVYQFYLDLIKLSKKTMVISDKASWIFSATPYVVFATSITAAFLVPMSLQLDSIGGDMIMLISMLALGRFFMVLAGLDTASTFGGMGSSRAVMMSSLFEPALVVSIFTLAFGAGTTRIDSIIKYTMSLGWGVLEPGFILVFISIFIVLIAESARIPVDDPSTHLELTMIHEAMLLEYSGKYLALMEYGASIKQLFYICLLGNIFIPTAWIGSFGFAGLSIVFVSLLFFVVKIIIITAMVAITEVFTVKLKLYRVTELATFSFTSAFIGFLHMFVIGGK